MADVPHSPALPASPALQSTSNRSGKNVVVTEAGKSPWYDSAGKPRQAYIVGVAGGSASGKTSVARAIVQSLRNVPWVAIVSQDSFYNSLSPEQSKLAFENNFDFDHPNAFDYDVLYQCIEDLKNSRAVEIPVYSFVHHQRMAEKKYMYGASIVILEGIFVLHDPQIRKLLDLKVFVQADSDLMLARRIRRDMIERDRDPAGIIDQYLRFVKPSMDNFVSPTSKFADIIVPGENNSVAIDVIGQQIRRQLELRDDVRMRHQLSRTPATPRRELLASPFDGPDQAWHSAAAYMPASVTHLTPRSAGTDALHPLSALSTVSASSDSNVQHPLESELPPNVHVLRQTPQLRALLTIMHDMRVTGEDFVFTIDRLSTLVMEESMTFLPVRKKLITLKSNGKPHTGTELAVNEICSVSILRSGTVLESSARRVLPALARGTILIQSQADGEVRLYSLDLPGSLKSRKRAQEAWVMLLDSQIGTGAAALMAIRVLLDHGVQEQQIVFCCLLVSVKGGVHALHRAFPHVRIIVAGVDPDLRRRVVWEKTPSADVLRAASTSRTRRHPNGAVPHIALDNVRVGQRAMADVVAYNEENDSSGSEDESNSRLVARSTARRPGPGLSSPSSPSSSSRSGQRSRVCFAIYPGAGNIGDRYFGTTVHPDTANDVANAS